MIKISPFSSSAFALYEQKTVVHPPTQLVAIRLWLILFVLKPKNQALCDAAKSLILTSNKLIKRHLRSSYNATKQNQFLPHHFIREVGAIVPLKSHHRLSTSPPSVRWKHGRQGSGEGQGIVGRLAHEAAQRTGQPDQPPLRCCADGTSRFLTLLSTHKHQTSSVSRQLARRPAQRRVNEVREVWSDIK